MTRYSILSGTTLLAGLSFPFLIISANDVYHHDDYETFSRWADCWLNNGSAIYLNCGVNYPSVGALASAGALYALKTIVGIGEYSKIVNYFRFYLAIFDALNFLLICLLGKALKLKYPLQVGLFIAVLPSSWVGSALWGQIDGVTQFFLLVCILCLVLDIQSTPDRNGLRSIVCFTGALLALAAFVMTKQLAIFSLPALAALVLLASFNLWTINRRYAVILPATFLLACVFFRFIDSRFQVPPDYYGSGYLFVWLAGGIGHGDNISGNGFNIWTFLGRDMWSSSRESFACVRLSDHRFCSTPFHSGLALYGLYVLALTTIYTALCWRLQGSRYKRRIQLILATLIMYLGQVNLGFNVFLTGTHERYLYHCFPFLILAAFYFFEQTELMSWHVVLFLVVVATIYGGFVYWVLSPSLPNPHGFVATIHLILLIYLFAFSLKLLALVGKHPVRLSITHKSAHLPEG
jgi:hypothetical protein